MKSVLRVCVGDGFVRLCPVGYMSIVLTIDECNKLASGEMSVATDIGTIVRYFGYTFTAYYLGDASRHTETVRIGWNKEDVREEQRNKITCSIWEENIPAHLLRVLARAARMVGKERKEFNIDLSRFSRYAPGSGIVVETGSRDACNDNEAVERVIQIAKNSTRRWSDCARVAWYQSSDRSCIDWYAFDSKGRRIMNGCLADRGSYWSIHT
jgi:hypothetical protein